MMRQTVNGARIIPILKNSFRTILRRNGDLLAVVRLAENRKAVILALEA